jgi:SAM-dependent methyltransferase
MGILDNFDNSKFTAKKRDRVSFPCRVLYENSKLKGRILDFGCGYGKDVEFLNSKKKDITGYDLHFKPEHPKGKFDTIICFYVLNVVFFEERANIIMIISELLKPFGKAYFAVRRDLKKTGFREHYTSKKITFQENVILPFNSYFENDFCEIYEFSHFNLKKIKEDKNLSDYQLITESQNFIAIANESTLRKEKFLILYKSEGFNLIDLIQNEKSELWLIINRVLKIVELKYKPTNYDININNNQKKTSIEILFRYQK